MYECKRCGYSSDRLCNLKKHLNKKNECEPKYSNDTVASLLANLYGHDKKEKHFNCDDCGKEYASRSGLFFHKKKNNCKSSEKPTPSEPNIDINKLLHELLQKHLELESKIDALTNQQHSTVQMNNNGVNNGVINNIQINLNNYGEENLQHLSDEFLNDCVKRLNTGVKNLVKHIHFNPEIPENQNIRLLSKKHNLLQIFRDGQWHPCDKNNTLDEMIKKGYRILHRHFIDNRNETSLELSDKIQDYFVNLINKEPSIYYNLRRELFVMIMDNTLYVLTNQGI